MKSGISRRDFMKGAAAGTLGLAAASLFGDVPAAGAEAGVIPAEKPGALTEEILAPLLVTNGCDPNWARDVLMGIMAPYWVCLAKNETAMESALAQVCQFRDEIIPKLRATDGHGLRLCHEMKHKALIAEAKLRASLERRESRGYHYRTDYPYRDDENFLCCITVAQGENGGMKVGTTRTSGRAIPPRAARSGTRPGVSPARTGRRACRRSR